MIIIDEFFKKDAVLERLKYCMEALAEINHPRYEKAKQEYIEVQKLDDDHEFIRNRIKIIERIYREDYLNIS